MITYKNMIKKIFRSYPELKDVKIRTAFFPKYGWTWVKGGTPDFIPENVEWLQSKDARMLCLEIEMEDKTVLADYNTASLLR